MKIFPGTDWHVEYDGDFQWESLAGSFTSKSQLRVGKPLFFVGVGSDGRTLVVRVYISGFDGISRYSFASTGQYYPGDYKSGCGGLCYLIAKPRKR